MKPKKLLKIFQKGSKAASKRKGKAPAEKYAWPSGIRIGVYGHSNSGKTVYFTILNEDCRVSKKLQISVSDMATYNEFLSNYRQIMGLDSSAGDGTIVDLRGEQNFPEHTEGDRLLRFNFTLDRGKKLSVVSYDYDGEAVSISSPGDLHEKVLDFMDRADGLIFFYDPKLLSTDLASQAQVASFVTMLERLAPLNSRLPIPVALVVTKSDVLPGFSGESESILVQLEDEQFLSEDFELFLEKVLSSKKIAANPAWASSVRNVLVKLKDCLTLVVGRTLNFQIFFISCTGQVPEKIGAEVGRSIYKPPKIIRPVGVQEPFYWMLKSVIRNRSISRFSRLARIIAYAGIIWTVAYSLPYLYHLEYLLPHTTAVEENILKEHSNDYLGITDKERPTIVREYDRYSRALTVKWFFPEYALVAGRISETYRNFDLRNMMEYLDRSILHFSGIVAKPKLWPVRNPKDSSIVLSEDHKKLEENLNKYHAGDSTSTLFQRSDRVLGYWDLFKRSIVNSPDTLTWSLMTNQVKTDRDLYGKELSVAENKLMDALRAKKTTRVQMVVSESAGMELGDRVDRINGNNDPEYRLDAVLIELKDIRKKLGSGQERGMIDNYLSRTRDWSNSKKFRYRVEIVPDEGVLYVEVTRDGVDPTWSEFLPIYQDEEYEISWKVGNDIHIAFCEANKDCKRGSDPSDKIVLDGKYSIFEMGKDLHFKNIDKHVTLRFKPPLTESLPRLE